MKFIYNSKTKNLQTISFFIRQKKFFISFFCILFLVSLYFLVDFSSQSLVSHDEGLYARRSRLIEESYNWFSSPFHLPHHKTIGSYWFIALSIRLFGKSELALRLPSILASFLSLFTSYLIAVKISNKKAAFIAVFSLASMPLWMQYSRYASPDIPFVLCILLVILFFLKFIDTSLSYYKFFYILFSGLFLSIAFFIRSYMAFLPFIGLTPFFVFNLLKNKNIFKITFLIGIILGSIPTLINLYFSYKSYGSEGVTLLFDFAKNKALGGVDFTNAILIPLNYIYLTFPSGIILLILVVFTRSETNIKYPLLVYLYPLLSFFFLLCMSTSYLHYYLFLLPSLSLLFATKLQSFSFRFIYSKIFIRNLLISFLLLFSLSILLLLFFYNESLLDYSKFKIIFLYVICVLLIISFISSFRFLFVNSNSSFNLKKFFYSIAIPQLLSISLLYNYGIIGNPNSKLKSFLNDEKSSLILNSNTIYLYNVDSKMKTLLSYYLPSSQIIESSDNILIENYIITSDRNFMNDNVSSLNYEIIYNFDNHFLLRKNN